MTLANDLKGVDAGSVHLISIPLAKWQKASGAIVKEMLKKNELCVYITFNKPFNVLKRNFEKEKIDTKKVYIIDGITTVNTRKKEKDVWYIGSTPDLTNIDIIFNEILDEHKGKNMFIVFDSLSTLLIYNSLDMVSKFARAMTDACSTTQTKTVVLTTKTSDTKLMERVVPFFTGFVELK